MNREIKFRVWDKENKIMILKPCWIGFNTNTLGFGDGFAKDFKDIELMQYTGLKDKNGKEIYEGDILDSKTDAQIYVNYNKEWGCYDAIDTQEKEVQEDNDLIFMNVNYGLLSNCLQDGEYEIIGNIYENPNLIK